jgi:hypothetical protein
MDAEKVFKNLRLDKAQHILIVDAPPEYDAALAGYSYDTKPVNAGGYDFVQVFAKKQADLETLLKEVILACKYDCVLWACYPKGAGKIKSDIKRETVWTAFDLVNLETVTAVSINDTWSALRGRPKDAVGRKR